MCFLEISWADISYICGRVRVAGCFRVLLLLRTFELLPELLFEPLSRSLGSQAIARHGRQGYTRVALHTTISDQPSSIADAFRVLFVGDDTVHGGIKTADTPRGSRPRDFLGTLVILELARNVDYGDFGSNESEVEGPRGKVG